MEKCHRFWMGSMSMWHTGFSVYVCLLYPTPIFTRNQTHSNTLLIIIYNLKIYQINVSNNFNFNQHFPFSHTLFSSEFFFPQVRTNWRCEFLTETTFQMSQKYIQFTIVARHNNKNTLTVRIEAFFFLSLNSFVIIKSLENVGHALNSKRLI